MDIKQLMNFSIFSNLSEEEVDHFRDVTKSVHVHANDTFIKEGEIGDSIYLLLDGEVEINQALTMTVLKGAKDNREKSILRLSGNSHPVFGEMCLFNENDRRTANVKALTDCFLFQIMKGDLYYICDNHPRTGYKVMQNLCRLLCGNLVKANESVLKLTTAFSLVLER